MTKGNIVSANIDRLLLLRPHHMLEIDCVYQWTGKMKLISCALELHQLLAHNGKCTQLSPQPALITQVNTGRTQNLE